MTALIGLELAGRLVLVVGGGPVAARRVASLRAQGAHVRLVAPQLCEDLADVVADGRGITWYARTVQEADLAGAWLVHTATGDAAVDRAVARWADARRVWCVNAGDASSGSARVPAVARHGDVVVAVTSADAPDPRRSSAVRDQLAAHLRSGAVDLRSRRSTRPGAPGRVVLVGGGPGDADLLTIAGRRALAQADVVVADRLGPTSVLDELPVDVEVIDVGKAPGHHPVPQAEINRLLVEHAQRGRVVVRLKGGDPYVLGRGGEEVLACRAAGVPVEVIPGVTSAVAVPAAAGIPLTHRGTATEFHVVTGHAGLGPGAAQALAAGSATVVVLMGVALIPAIAAQALAAGADPATPVALVEDGTRPTQRVTRTTLAHVAQDAVRAGVQAPAVIVIGRVAAMDLSAGATAKSGAADGAVAAQGVAARGVADGAVAARGTTDRGVPDRIAGGRVAGRITAAAARRGDTPTLGGRDAPAETGSKGAA